MGFLEPNQVLRLLTEVSEAFSGHPNNRSLIQRILETSIRLAHAERGMIFLAPEYIHDEQDEWLAIGLNGEEVRYDVHHSIIGQVFRGNEPRIIHDSSKDPRSLLAVPLRAPGGRAHGVIQVLNHLNGGFTEEEGFVLSIVALLGAIAMGHRESLEAVSYPPSVAPPADILENQGSPANAQVINFNLRLAKQLFEQKLIERALARTDGNKTEAARLLGITREGLRKAMLKKTA